MGTLPDTESIRLDDRTIAPEEESLRVAESEEKSDPSECQGILPELAAREYQLAWYVLDGCAPDAIYALDILGAGMPRDAMTSRHVTDTCTDWCAISDRNQIPSHFEIIDLRLTATPIDKIAAIKSHKVDTSPASATTEAMVSCAADQPTPSSSSPSRVRDGDEATPEEREKLLVTTTSSAAAAVVVVGNGSPARTSWRKVRQGVAVTSAMASSLDTKKRRMKKTGGGLSRQDSFMARFSTRQQADDAGDIERHRSRQEGTRLARCRAKLLRRLFGVITTDSTFMGYWLLVLTSAVLYNVWMCIARESFPELQREYQLAWYVLDGCADAIYALDILVQVRTGYLEQGIVITDARKLAAHYLRSKHVIVDVLSLTPLDLVQLWTAERHPMLRFPRYLKAYRAVGLYYNIESRSAFPNLWRVVNLIHILLLLAHWFAGFYYTISVSENFVGRWTYPTPVGVFATLRRKYLACLYWSTLTLTTIGDLPPPETNSHQKLYCRSYVFTIVSYLIGVFVFATIVGQVGNIITNRNANRLEFERLLDGAKQYMRNHSVPMDMQKRVMRWYIYSWSRGSVNGGGDIHSLGLLPDKLKTELALHVNLSTLKKVTIFQECQPEFLHDLVLKMKGSIFTPGDLICRKGEVAREMFIIADGILEVIGCSAASLHCKVRDLLDPITLTTAK
ncbi:PREDICTED: cyclic nucleotide-gated cation channel alpha-3-like [Priapulus caudatus]|uniref:Cyclic nucleotide-gated cation channel alpha-3-like n=1 Tax=Priapulus caudatus TaxID=37621 RepID=A0ABM1E5E0_PRICU|nr:PREDICTED: cyclic nucleotide-gated cation channel alpha-3-like [Priapulus caudatus]